MKQTTRRRAPLVGAATIAALGLAVTGSASSAWADSHDATLSVLHGVPDTTVDVWVDGELTVDDFEPGDMAGPLELPAGTYSVAITAADAEDASDPVIGPVDLTLDAGGNYTAVAHLDAGGAPTATLFMNDLSETAAGEGRLTVRHVAAAPAVDVLAGGEPVITGLENPDEALLDLPAGTVSASVAAAGTTEPVLGPADVEIADGVNTIVYAWGSLDDDTLALATQTIDGLHSAPGGVPAGTSGMAADATPNAMVSTVAVVAGLLLAGLAVAAATRKLAGAHRGSVREQAPTSPSTRRR
ncbi:DUF4397 domain-containing protein [Myceligenerans xiligouense]|uniref:Uncharacterized protein DUF4397 n=1 Tax=Myceligenerans xiligouense TaxID=253184 RepID=A0A3N4YLD9_9MICO|nr:DUF4397 domain-containing protein [Myceligenerans xiligouense]RPF20917.1 uncharacterized protein DUF4397 [Myceligenerans xiligouense]